MLTEIKLRNFKCFQDIAFNLRPLTVLTGINGMGKSSLIQAILLLRQSGKPPIRKLLLNGSLFSLGYGQDLLYEFAPDDSNIVLAVKENEKRSWIFEFAYEKDGRVLERIERTKNEQRKGILWSDNFYYMTAERTGPRKLFSMLSENPLNPIGNSGEYCEALLNEYGSKKCSSPLCRNDFSDNSILSQTEAWLSALGQPVRLHIDTSRDTDSVSLTFSFLRDRIWSNNYRASNVGFGLTYVLPVFVSCLVAEKGGLIIIENPEAHLHPKGQALLGSFLARAAQSGVQIIIETHSDHILNGIRIAVKKGYIKASNTAVHFFRHDPEKLCSFSETPEIDSNGRINIWPEGFFDEWEKSLLELL